MKTLYLNRHAKSSWENMSISDFSRPLNKRGKRDAPFMGKLLCTKVEKPHILITSPAVRAKATAYVLSECFELGKDEIIENEQIYEATVSDLINIIKSVPKEKNIVMLVGHNPAFTMLSNHLTDNYIDNIPTCGFVQINFDTNNWKDIDKEKGKLVFFEYPKKYKK
ncbi:MAG: phosphohistidine phosphatase [Ignavibacteriae bacterium]|nr:MAG: phosphohistidine phosphatase [Ignavibacteriota bacterium]